MRSKLFDIFSECQALILFFSAIISFNMYLQTTYQWTPQAEIPSTDIYSEEPPFLIADQDRTVHAFDSHPIDLENENSQRVIYYRQWTPEGSWTNLLDIILDPRGGNLDLQDVYYDSAGFVHLLAQMDNEDLYYTQAVLANAGKATSWSTPVFIAGQSTHARKGMPFIAALGGDGHGKLVVIFSGYRDGNGLYTTYSLDNGKSWTDPYPIYLTYDPNIFVVAPRVSSGEAGLLHAVWSTANTYGNGEAGYYANFDFEKLQWSDPIALDVAGIKTPNIIEYDGNLIVSYYHHNVNGNWWRKSTDNGQTWSNPERISPIHIGTNGIVSFAIDSDNQLHAFFGQRIDDNNHGMWHTLWNGNGWSAPEAVVRGPSIQDVIGGDGFDPRSARAIVLDGNILLVTWGTDGAAGTNGAWYSYATLDTLELPVRTLVTPSEMPTIVPSTRNNTIPSTPIVAPMKPTVPDLQANGPITIIGSPTFPLVISISTVSLSIIFLVGAWIIIQRIRH
jgi:hypothetical protein